MITREELIKDEAKKDHLDFLDACLEAYGRATIEEFIEWIKHSYPNYNYLFENEPDIDALAEQFLKGLK